ncbi:hypothetical protein [Rhizobium sp. BR 314]|uniref:hypothetical protein n=1 Tax=Rhizobium sp. BR 314 TaxID=3040013 RepID=UPI0039BED532
MLVVDFILETLGYGTSRIILPLISLGWVEVQALSAGETGFNWLGFKRITSGGFLCQAQMAGWIGLLPWALLLLIVIPYLPRN